MIGGALVEHEEGEQLQAKPCRFCACKRLKLLLMSDERKRWVYCRGCHASGPIADNNAEAVAGWNKAWEKA